jgi:hypothetical protein
MADKHLEGIKKARAQWTPKGRLFRHDVGLYLTTELNPTKLGEKGHPDLSGYKKKSAELNYPIPVYVDVKTLAYKYCSRDQFLFMEARYRDNCLCYIFRENEDGGWDWIEWAVERKRYLKKWGY